MVSIIPGKHVDPEFADILEPSKSGNEKYSIIILRKQYKPEIK